MYLSFNDLPVESKVWVYQSDKKLTSTEKDILSRALRTFTEEWLVHGSPLEASFEIRHDRFVLLAANDGASGCSIDNSVRIMKDLGQTIGVDFFNRSVLAFYISSDVLLIPMNLLNEKISEGLIDGATLYFNNTVATLQELQESWLLPAGSTWLKRYFATRSIPHNH